MNSIPDNVRTEIEAWLDNVIIGLNLCPFAAKPRKQDSIKITISSERTDQQILHTLHQQIRYLAKHPETATTLLVLTEGLQHFEHYNQFLALADDLIEQNQWQGVFQIASFHPDYQFAGTAPSDQENLTNRSPYPILHILREQDIQNVLQYYPDPDNIPLRNINRMDQLSRLQISTLFPYLKN